MPAPNGFLTNFQAEITKMLDAARNVKHMVNNEFPKLGGEDFVASLFPTEDTLYQGYTKAQWIAGIKAAQGFTSDAADAAAAPLYLIRS